MSLEKHSSVWGWFLRKRNLLGCLAAFVFMALFPSMAVGLDLEQLRLPAGFSIEVYAQVENARSLALGDKGTVFVGTRSAGDIYALVDQDGDGKDVAAHTLMRGLNMPNAVAFRDGSLYVSEVHRLWRLGDIENRLAKPQRPEMLYDQLPADKHHGWRYMSFGPDGMLYLAVGAPCNVCEEPDPYATIVRFDPGNWRPEIFARGIRNSVGLTFHPETGELWFTNNGRDWMGDDLPPDSVHKAPSLGLNFGFPYCHAGVPDPELNQSRDCATFAPAQLKLPAHSAALGLEFYAGAMFPEEYQGRLFIAEHGSWNRSTPVGYRVTMAREQNGTLTDYEVFAEGWLQGGSAWGRPVDLEVLPDGSMLLSDDKAGVVYRITYRPSPQ